MECSRMQEIELSIVMINHNTKKMTEAAIDSILDASPIIAYEVIVVDNSTEEQQTVTYQHENVKILSNIENKGFAHGCNIGAKAAEGEYLLFLNSDTIMHRNTLEFSLDYFKQHDEIGGLGVRLLLENGQLDHACKRGFPTPWNSFCYFTKLDKLFPHTALFNGYRLGHLDEFQIYEVDAVNGAYLLMSASLYWQLGGFDETFFMYGEDLDLCYKIKRAGFHVVYYPEVTCTHLKGQSGRKSKNTMVQYHFYQAMLIFYERYYEDVYPKLLTSCIKWVLRKKMGKDIDKINNTGEIP